MKIGKYSREVFSGKGGLTRFLATLENDLSEAHRRLDVALRFKHDVHPKVRVLSTGTEVRHRLGRVPFSVRVLPKGNVLVYEDPTKPRTVTSVYLKAATDVDAEVEVMG